MYPFGSSIIHSETCENLGMISDDLGTSAKAGCFLCVCVLEVICAVSGSEPPHLGTAIVGGGSNILVLVSQGPPSKLMKIDLFTTDGTSLLYTFVSWCFRSILTIAISDMSAQLFHGEILRYPQRVHNIARDTSSPHSLIMASSWLETCISTHKTCGTSSQGILPTRLIDVSSPTVKIVETSGQYGRYAALSHCWGTSGSVLASQVDNYHDFRQR